jgi:hypothetical protein
MAALFHVFVDGVADGSTAGLDRLADEMATKYGLARNDLQSRLQRGRVRVKANVERANADALANELRAIGARCAIEPADGSRASTPAIGRAPTPPPVYQSGLAAAFSGEMPKASLGALEKAELGELSLASVDGGEAPATVASPAAFEPPAPPPVAKRPGTPPPTKSAKPKDEPLDLFAPPDAGDAELPVELAPEEIQRASPAAPRRASAPMVAVRATSAPAPAAPRSKLGPLANARVRFAVGVVLAIVLGFVPAHLYASSRESSAFNAIDDDVAQRQQSADSHDDWEALDAFRASALDRKRDERRSIARFAIALWMIVGGGLGYVWFRRVPWQKLEG